VNGTLFFVATNGDALSNYETNYEVWKSDGTAAGTRLVKDINLGPGASEPAALTDVAGTLFFSACEGSYGCELWRSNGTAAGTTRALDLAPGPESASPSALVSQGGKLFFAADDGVHGREIWQSDGAAAGTKLVQDIAAGPADSDPANLAFAAGRLFFSADDGHTGQELWAVSIGPDAYLQLPAVAGVTLGGVAAIPVHYGNHGLSSVGARALAVTLDPALTYLGDTSSITPTVSGQTLTWRLLDGAPGENAWTLRVRVPTAAYGTRYPVTLTLMADIDTYPSDNTARIEVMIARQVFLPVLKQ
jgi:ELWxxDGT repeat protein